MTRWYFGDKIGLNWDLQDKIRRRELEEECPGEQELWGEPPPPPQRREMASHVAGVKSVGEYGKSRSERWTRASPCRALQRFNLRTERHGQIYILRSLWLKCAEYLGEQSEWMPERRLLLMSHRKMVFVYTRVLMIKMERSNSSKCAWETNWAGLGNELNMEGNRELILISKTFPWQHIPVTGASLMLQLCPWEKYSTSRPTSRYGTGSRAGISLPANLPIHLKDIKTSFNPPLISLSSRPESQTLHYCPRSLKPWWGAKSDRSWGPRNWPQHLSLGRWVVSPVVEWLYTSTPHSLIRHCSSAPSKTFVCFWFRCCFS